MKTVVMALSAAFAIASLSQAHALSPKGYKDARLSKSVVETAYACLRRGMNDRKDSGLLFSECVSYTESQVEPLNPQMKFRLALLVYRTVHDWGKSANAPVKLSSPATEEGKCVRASTPASCMMKATTQAFIEHIEILSEIQPDSLESLRDALVESGG